MSFLESYLNRDHSDDAADEDPFYFLHRLYAQEVLPHFGITDSDAVSWGDVNVIVEGDEAAHYFLVGDSRYILFFEDYQGFGSAEARHYIEQEFLEPNETFEYVQPTSPTEIPPSYDGFRLKGSGYIPNETGTFTLIKSSISRTVPKLPPLRPYAAL